MSKKQEDNRDVFDKVADYMAPAVGAVIGGVVGRKIGRKATRSASTERERARIGRRLENDDWIDDAAGEALQNRAWKLDRQIRANRAGTSRLTAAGASVGAGSGYVAGQEAKKRRK